VHVRDVGVGLHQAVAHLQRGLEADLRPCARRVGAGEDEYEKAWAGIYPLELEYQRFEMQPQFATIAMPSEIVIATSFTLEIGDTTGTMHFCIPYSTRADPRGALHERAKLLARAGRALAQPAEAADPVGRGRARCRARDRAGNGRATAVFKPGDFIELELNPVIQAKVDGVPVFDCHYGTPKGKYSIKIDKLLTGSTSGWLGESHVA
jgi:flagellar motor switch protein FliM